MYKREATIVGGGPAGLLAARLLARAGFGVTVFERLNPGATYGFGVALAGRALDRLRAQDPVAAERIAAVCHPLTRWTMRRGSESASVEEHGAFGVGRTDLLSVLHALAGEAGAQVKTGAVLSPADLGAEDIVIFADGVASHGREQFASEFGARVETVPISYIWCGSNIELDAMTLDLRASPDGLFCGHVMPYGNGRCTFQIDTPPPTLQSAGLALDRGEGDSGSDEESLSLLSDLFASTLGNRRLLGNRSRWNLFRQVTCEHWSHGRFVLVGDAAHTAHYTVGSGTRMAMEDAIALSQALIEAGDPADAFAAYEAERRPAVEHLQWRARRSQDWWRTLSLRFQQPLATLMFSYFTRTGSVMLEPLTGSNPSVVRAAIAHLRPPRTVDGGSPSDGSALDPGLALGTAAREVLAGRVLQRAELAGFNEIAGDALPPWSPQSAEAARGPASRGVLLTGSADSRRVLDRFDLAEEIRTATAVPVAVAVAPEGLEIAATALTAARADYVVIEGRTA